MSKTYGRKAGRVVRRTLKDGSVRTYRYGPHRGPAAAAQGDTIEALMFAYEHSPEWRKLSRSTQATYSRYLTYFAGIGSIEAKMFDRRAVMELRDHVAEDRGDGAANTFMIAASALFSWGVKRNWLVQSPCLHIERLDGGEYPAWSWEEVELALAHLREPLRRAVILALYTGQRRGDVCHMTWADYNGSKIRVRPEKTRKTTPKPLVIPCHPSLSAELDAWERVAPTLLVSDNGRPWRPSHISNAMCDALRRIKGFPEHRNIHGLRKLAATLLAEGGCSTHEIAAITGHKSLAMIALYTASAQQEKLATAAVLRFPTLKAKA